MDFRNISVDLLSFLKIRTEVFKTCLLFQIVTYYYLLTILKYCI